MAWVLTAFFSKVVIILLLLVALAALTLSRVRRRLRISPGVRSEAPLTWLASPVPTARLHRRLRSAVESVRLARGPRRRFRKGGDPTAVQRLADDVEREALAVGDRLVVVAKLGPGERRRALVDLAADVRRIEQLAHRVVELTRAEAATPQLPGTPTALDDLTDRVARISQAHAELSVIDTTAGLAVPAPPPPPPGVPPAAPAIDPSVLLDTSARPHTDAGR